MKLTRDFYKSGFANDAIDFSGWVTLEGGIEFATVEHKNGKCYAMGFQGRAQKPAFNYRFNSSERMYEFIQGWVEKMENIVQLKEERKEKAKADKKEMADKVKVGSFFYSSWGYDQTNVNFYKVIEKKGVTVKLVEVAPVVVSSGYSDSVIPSNEIIGEPMTKRLNQYGVKISYVQTGRLYDGKPKHRTNSYYHR